MPAQGAQLFGKAVQEKLQLLARGGDFLGAALRGLLGEILGKGGIFLPRAPLAAAEDRSCLPLRHEPDEVREAQAPVRLPAPEHLSPVREQDEEDLLGEVFDLLTDVAAG